MHEGGFRIKPNHAGEWYFETAAGKHLLTLGRHPVAEARLGYAPSLTLLPQSVVTNDIRKGAKPNGAVFVPRAA
jgi:hypothetical protein